MSNTAYDPRIHPVTGNGEVYPGAKLNFYEVGGAATRKATYQEDSLTTPHANPVVADANGRFAAIHLDGAYYVEMTDSSDVTIWTMDNYNKGIADIIADLAASNASLFAQDTATTTGLTFGYQAGRVDKGNGTIVEVAASTIALTDNTTNIVYLDYADDTVKTSTTAPGANTAILFHVVTSAGDISTVTEKSSSYRTPSERAFPPDHLSGLSVSLDSDADHDVQIAVGTARDAGDNQDISLTSVITKQIDVSWAEGDDAGGFPTGISLTNNTRYRVFVIVKTDGTVDAGFDTAANASNLLADASDYSYYRQVGWLHTDGSSNISGLEGVSPAGVDRVLLDVIEFNGQTSITFSDDIDSDYDEYEIIIRNLVPSAASDIRIRTGVGSDDTGASDYNYTSHRARSGDTADAATASYIAIGNVASFLDPTAAQGGLSTVIRIMAPADSSIYTGIHHSGRYPQNGVAAGGKISGAGWRAAAQADDRLTIYPETGNLASGKALLVGVRV